MRLTSNVKQWINKGLIMDYTKSGEHEMCFEEKLFSLIGCLFSSEDVREIVADSSMFSNFTMNLLGGEDKECRTIDEIQKCIVVILDSCPNNSRSNVFKYFSELAMKSMECKVDTLQNRSATISLTSSEENTQPINEKILSLKHVLCLSFNDKSKIKPIS